MLTLPSYILEKDKIIKVEKETLNNDEVIKYLIEILYRLYDIGFDIISKILFSEFLEKFMKNVNDLELKIGYDRSFSATRSHEKRGSYIHNPK